MERGVLLIAYGKRGYGFAAYNLAFSIKYYNPKIKVAILYEKATLDQVPHNVFDSMVEMPPDMYMDGPFYNPAKAKINALANLPYEQTLYLDVDTFCCQDIMPLFDQFNQDFVVDIFGSGGYGTEIPYDVWAKHEDSFPFFGLEQDQLWHTTNTSWYFAKRDSMVVRDMYKMLKHYLAKGFPQNKLKQKWGKYLPDELLFSGVLSRLNTSPQVIKPMYFCNDYQSGTDVTNKYYFLSMYGNGKGLTLVKPHWYDFIDKTLKIMFDMRGMKHNFKVAYIQEDKHLNNR